MHSIKDYEIELRNEQKKLNRLIQQVLKGPIAKNDALIEQSRKVDQLIEMIQAEKEKLNINSGGGY